VSNWNIRYLWIYRDALSHGLSVTIFLNLAVLILGTSLGIVIAGLRLSDYKLLRIVGRVYVDLFRSLPVLVLLIWIFFALPLVPGVGIRLNPFAAAVVGLSLNLGAFVAEIIRAGVLSVPPQHVEAAKLTGMTAAQVTRHVVLPIGLRLALPPLFGQYLNQVKLSVLASIIAVPELLHTVDTISTEVFRPLEFYTALAVIFLGLLLPATWLQGRMEAASAGKKLVATDDFADRELEHKAVKSAIPFLESLEGLRSLGPVQMLNVSASYNQRTVLSEVSITLKPGSVTALLGANGSGKTTLLRALAGVIPVFGGSISLDGVDCPRGLSRSLRVGCVLQEYEPWPHLTVEQNITLPLQLVLRISPEEAKRRALKWLLFVGLERRGHDKSTHLSGGQRQRLAFARALCLQPGLILLDEPTSAMDFRWALHIQEAVADLRQTGVTVLVVSHSLSFIRKVADQVIFLDRGTVCELGPADVLLTNPRSEELNQFLQTA
jgi:polar amino acid transport system permease protein